jgi:hypothetical protein
MTPREEFARSAWDLHRLIRDGVAAGRIDPETGAALRGALGRVLGACSGMAVQTQHEVETVCAQTAESMSALSAELAEAHRRLQEAAVALETHVSARGAAEALVRPN